MKNIKILFSLFACLLCITAFSTHALASADQLAGKWVISIDDTLNNLQELTGTALSSQELAMTKAMLNDVMKDFSLTFDIKKMKVTASLGENIEETEFKILKDENNHFFLQTNAGEMKVEIQGRKLVFSDPDSDQIIVFKR